MRCLSLSWFKLAAICTLASLLAPAVANADDAAVEARKVSYAREIEPLSSKLPSCPSTS